MTTARNHWTAAILTVFFLGGTGLSVGAGEPRDSAVKRQGPLAGLPSRPGPHIDKIKALGDNAWLELGAPAADPKWGTGRGRSWGCKMPYAPVLQGAFLAGQGIHGFIKTGHFYCRSTPIGVPG
jgi:hypothetical protein